MEKPADELTPVPAQKKNAPTLPPDVLAVAVFQPRRATFSRRALVLYSIWALLIVIIGAEAGYLVSNLADKEYGARTEVYYQLTENNSTGFLRQDRALSTQLVKIKSREVLAPVAEANHRTVDQLAAKVHASVLQDSEVLRIEVDDASRDRAQSLTGAVTAAYLKVAQTERDTASSTIDALNQQLNGYNAQIADLNSKLASASSSGTTAINNQLQNVYDLRSSTQSRIDELTVEKARQPQVNQLTQPYLLDDPVSPKPMKTAIAGGLAGFALVAAAATFLIRRHLADQRD